MKLYAQQMISIFSMMKTNPARMEELKDMLKQLLNKITTSNECLKIIQSRNGNDPFFVMVVPLKYDILINTKNVPTGYYIDLDIDKITRPVSLGGLTPEEATAWLFHELAHNVLTSTSKLRVQMLLALNLDDSIREKYGRVFKDDISSYFWCDIHSRTYKEILNTQTINYEADRILVLTDLCAAWNSALNKYIDGCGGNPNVIAEDHNDRLDLAALKLLNSFIRENFTTRPMVYSADIQMMARMRKYVAENVQSNLLREFLSIKENNNPTLEMTERESFRTMDDSLIRPTSSHDVMNESTSYNHHDSHHYHDSHHHDSSQVHMDEHYRLSALKYNDILKKIDRLGFEMEDIRTIDDKIAIMYNIRDLMKVVDREIKKSPDNDLLRELRDRLESMLHDLKGYKIQQKEYRFWMPPAPAGYEG